jgi:hypothetical protein
MVESEGSHRPFSHSWINFRDRAGSSFDPSAAIVRGAAWRVARSRLASTVHQAAMKRIAELFAAIENGEFPSRFH